MCVCRVPRHGIRSMLTYHFRQDDIQSAEAELDLEEFVLSSFSLDSGAGVHNSFMQEAKQ